MDLDIIQYGWDILGDNEFSVLEQIREKGSVNSNFAISLLNNSPTYRDHIFEEVSMPDVIAGTEIKHIEDGSTYLKIRPNPATNKVYIDFIDQSISEDKLQVFDVSGKLVTNYVMNPVSGGGIELDISRLNEGFYFISVTDTSTGVVRSGKLIKVTPGK